MVGCFATGRTDPDDLSPSGPYSVWRDAFSKCGIANRTDAVTMAFRVDLIGFLEGPIQENGSRPQAGDVQLKTLDESAKA